ncbi:MAG: class I SAM-dependent methyltransferase [Rhizobiales bacterium]|nr:class I SAM-dependent methyltransferase [Hyphomicrobiales bacterium]
MADAATRINHRSYRQSWIVRELIKAAQRGIMPDEAYCLSLIPAAGRGKVLDIGIGAGRTCAPLSSMFGSYIGIDYSSELVAVARERNPGLDLRVMDGRALAFGEEFDAVVFSWNGIDSVDFESRLKILQEMQRVLKPGGYILYSTHNLHHDRVEPLMTRFWVRELFTSWKRTRFVAFRALNYRRRSRDDENGIYFVNDLGIGFRLLNAYVDIGKECARLEEMGMRLLATVGNTRSEPGFDARDCWVSILAQKR